MFVRSCQVFVPVAAIFSDFGFWVSGFDLSGVEWSESMAPLSALRQTGQPAPGTIPTIPTMPRCKLSSSTSPSSWWDNVPRKKCIQALSYPTIRVELINLRSCKLDLPLGFCVTKNSEFSFPNAIVSLLVWFEFLSLVWTFKVYLSWTASDSRALVSSSCSRRCRWKKLFVRPKNFFTMRRPSILQTSIFSFFL